MYKQDLLQKLITIQNQHSHPAWKRHCSNLVNELLQRDPKEFMDFQAIKETMFVGNAEYTFKELEELKDKIDLSELVDCDAFSQHFQHPNYPTTGNTIHHRYHLYVLDIPIKNINTIVELGGGYGNMARLVHKSGFSGTYNLIDLPEFELLQKYYLDYQGINACWNPDLTQPMDLFIATWSLSEIPLEDRSPYENLNTKYFLIAFGPNYNGIDNMSYFRKFVEFYPDHTWKLIEHPHLNNQYYLIGKVK